MLEEIREQPAALARTLESELRIVEELKTRLTRNRPRLVLLAHSRTLAGN